jgi:hypothetical protein
MIPITLQTVPVDLLLNVGTYLNRFSDDINVITLAATLKDYDMLERYMEKHALSEVSAMVALSGKLKVLKWVIKKGCPMDKYTSYHVAKTGHLKALKWVIKKGCPMDEETCSVAAYRGDIEMLQWLRSQSCPWDEWTSYRAAWNGDRDMLQWAIDHGCPEPMNNRDYDERKNRLLQ